MGFTTDTGVEDQMFVVPDTGQFLNSTCIRTIQNSKSINSVNLFLESPNTRIICRSMENWEGIHCQ